MADENRSLMGYIVGSIQVKQDRVLDKEGSIDEWFVTETARRTGIGKQLYDSLIEVFKQHVCNHIGLKIYSANKNIVELYHRMGLHDLEFTKVKALG